MSVKDFVSFLSTDPQLADVGRTVKTVDLLNLSKSSRTQHNMSGGRPRSALVVDGEDCLDRLYGGYFSDWSCGGQWGHMVDFLATLVGTLQQSNVQMAIFFNGALEPERFGEWRARQLHLRNNVRQVLKHVHKRATPPPKAWWVPPCAIQTMLRFALKSLNCSVLSSVEDHRLEVMGFCWENGYHGVMADDAEYAMFNPPRLLSAHTLKMSFQYDVTTIEYVLDEAAKLLDLNPNRFCLLGALLGNHILSAKELRPFHLRLAPELKDNKLKNVFDRVIRSVVNYIRALTKVDDLERICGDVFGTDDDPRLKKLKASLAYYQSASEDGYAKNKPALAANKGKKKKQQSSQSHIKLASEMDPDPRQQQPQQQSTKSQEGKAGQKSAKKEKEGAGPSAASKSSTATANDLVERIALDLDQLDLSEAISEAAKVMLEDDNDADDDDVEEGEESDRQAAAADALTDCGVRDVEGGIAADESAGGAVASGSEPNSDQQSMSVVQALASGVDVAPSEDGKYPVKKPAAPAPPPKSIHIPDSHAEICRTALERHRQSQMSPYIYQLLMKGEIKLPVLLEDVEGRGTEVPAVHSLYQPLRQAVYAVLFNLNHQKFGRKQVEEAVKAKRRKADEYRREAKKSKSEEEKKGLVAKAEACIKAASDIKLPEMPEVRVREWLPYNSYDAPDVVEAREISWSVPTLQRLWFGTSVEDKQKRLRAFLACLKCDDCPLLLHQAHVPQHMLILACVLRYIMVSTSSASPAPSSNAASSAPHSGVALRKPELDALLATAFSPELRNPRLMAEMKIDLVTRRGVQLSTMVMQGIEMAIFANDSCGAPLPFQMCLPWTFFDGKLFHAKLRKADSARNLMELCDGRMESVYAIERMRAAILHGLLPQYSNQVAGGAAFNAAVAAATNPSAAVSAAVMAAAAAAAARGGPFAHPHHHPHHQLRGHPGMMPHHPMMARGGQLVVGGAIVGQWNANMGQRQQQQQHMMAHRGLQMKHHQQQQQKKKNKKKQPDATKKQQQQGNPSSENQKEKKEEVEGNADSKGENGVEVRNVNENGAVVA